MYKVLCINENILRIFKFSLILKLIIGNVLLCKECYKGN